MEPCYIDAASGEALLAIARVLTGFFAESAVARIAADACERRAYVALCANNAS